MGRHSETATGRPGDRGSRALVFRSGTALDLTRCGQLLWPGDPSVPHRQELPALWEPCVGHGGFAVITDLNHPDPDTIDAFGLSVFVPDHVMDGFFDAPRSAALEYCRAVADGRQAVLSLTEIAKANAQDGINVLVVYSGLRYTDFADPRTLQTLGIMSAAFFFFHGGYRVRSILFETFGHEAAAFMEKGGFRALGPGADAAALASHTAESRSVWGLRREWVPPAAVSPLSQLFHPPPPRIGFARMERRLLERALLNESDTQIALGLGISSHAVRQTWRTIYARTREAMPRIIGPAAEGVRGPEKRRHLLEYLRMHLEELRPRR